MAGTDCFKKYHGLKCIWKKFQTLLKAMQTITFWKQLCPAFTVQNFWISMKMETRLHSKLLRYSRLCSIPLDKQVFNSWSTMNKLFIYLIFKSLSVWHESLSMLTKRLSLASQIVVTFPLWPPHKSLIYNKCAHAALWIQKENGK